MPEFLATIRNSRYDPPTLGIAQLCRRKTRPSCRCDLKCDIIRRGKKVPSDFLPIHRWKFHYLWILFQDLQINFILFLIICSHDSQDRKDNNSFREK